MANLEFRNPGGIPSKHDYRANLVASAVAAISATPTPTLPESLQTDFQRLGGSLDQQQTPACVSHAMAQLMKLWWYLKTGQIVNFSARFLHILSGLPQYNGGWAAGPDDGRDPLTVAKIAQKYGCPTTDVFPNDTSLSNTDYFNASAITPEILAAATQYAIPGYVTVPVTQFGIREAIQKYGAVSILLKIGKEWWTDITGISTWAQSGIDPLRAPYTVIGGHEVVGSGWNASLDHIVNSWSAGWAEHGESDYIWNEYEPYILEALAIAEIPSSTLALVQGLPASDEFSHNFQQSIGYGSSGSEVRALQIALAIDGCFGYPEITSFYGNITCQAVLAFQKKYQVAPLATLTSLNGRSVGPLTRAQLNKLFNK